MAYFDFIKNSRFNRGELADKLNIQDYENLGKVTSFTPSNPTVSAGSITVSSKAGEYSCINNLVSFSMEFTNCTLSNNASVTVTLPFTPAGGVRKVFNAVVYDGSAWKIARAFLDGSGNQVTLTYWDGSVFGSGSGRWFVISGEFHKWQELVN